MLSNKPRNRACEIPNRSDILRYRKRHQGSKLNYVLGPMHLSLLRADVGTVCLMNVKGGHAIDLGVRPARVAYYNFKSSKNCESAEIAAKGYNENK